jgi:hypothetical protein
MVSTTNVYRNEDFAWNLCEIGDNSLDAITEAMAPPKSRAGPFTIEFTFWVRPSGEIAAMTFYDNGLGMNLKNLEDWLTYAYRKDDRTGRVRGPNDFGHEPGRMSAYGIGSKKCLFFWAKRLYIMGRRDDMDGDTVLLELDQKLLSDNTRRKHWFNFPLQLMPTDWQNHLDADEVKDSGFSKLMCELPRLKEHMIKASSEAPFVTFCITDIKDTIPLMSDDPGRLPPDVQCDKFATIIRNLKQVRARPAFTRPRRLCV